MTLYQLRQRYGMTEARALFMLKNPDVLGMVLLRLGEVHGMITGLDQPFKEPLLHAIRILGPYSDQGKISSVQIMTTKNDVFFFADTAVNINPSEDTLVDTVQSSISFIKSLGFEPKVAFCSFSNFDKSRYRDNEILANAIERVVSLNPGMEIDGEMQIDLAMDPEYMARAFPFSRLKSRANLFIFPNLTASNIAYRLLLKMDVASTIGPVLLGVKGNLNILHRDADVDQIVNLAAVTAAKLPTH
jgi:malate dehydrogenase (oxaloacetate-decarboxylating)(NADP+)